MFKVVEIKNYDIHHRYGTDWHTDYEIETDEKFNTIDEVLEKMKELGHNVYGEIKMKTWHNENKIVIESIMY